MRLLIMGMCERPGIPTSDATVPSRGNFTKHSQCDESQLQRTWEELEYRFHVCKVTKGAHIEHL
jgi:hypothetical protein